ncbi:MAG TPA: sensor histidine kinase [Spirochaetia bacterium]|nr:sensor histidine kinase [Spirochaetia bacterium]
MQPEYARLLFPNHTMNQYWVAAFSLSVAMFAFAAYHLLVWMRRPGRHRDLSLALLFVVIGLYDYFVSRIYAGYRSGADALWFHLIAAVAFTGAPLFLWYISERTHMVSRRALTLWSVLLGIFALLDLIVPGDAVWVISRATPFSSKLPFVPELHFNRVSLGLIGVAGAVVGIVFLVHCVIVVARYAAAGHRSEGRSLAVVIALVALGVCNDALIGAGVYRFLFLTEYAWAAALIFLTYRASDEVISATEEMDRLSTTEARFYAMVEHVPFNIWACDPDGRLIMQNAADIKTVGNHVGNVYSEWSQHEGMAQFNEFSRRAFAGEIVTETVDYDVDGSNRIYRDIIAPVRLADSVIGTIGIGIDITDQRRLEVELSARLEEKEVLLRELHHRVKNNLQVITSLLRIRSEQIDDERSREIFLSMRREIDAIARIHAQLYLSDNLATIDFGEYLRQLAVELIGVRERQDLVTRFDLESVFLDAETAIPCALIANELITNTLKHSFSTRDSGEIVIGLHPVVESRILLSVEDDGAGIPEHVTLEQTSSFGLLLVSSLAAQLQGSVTIAGPRRNRIEVLFPAVMRK